jgi:drug/metabolite transporter (DMT)-like permease
MVASMLCFSSMDAMSKYIVHDYGIVQVLFVRSVIYVGFAALVAGRGAGLWRAFRTGRPWLQAGRAALAVVENGTFVLAFRYLPLADAHAVASSSPLIVVALSAPMLGERVGLDRWAAVLAGFVGVLLIIRPGFAQPNLALLIPLFGAVLWGLYQILVRLCSRSDPPETTLMWSAWVSLAMTSVGALPGWTAPSASAWLLLVGIGLLGAVGHFGLIKALDYAEAAAVQPYSYTLLLWVTVLGVLVFGDVPDAWTIAGGAVVVASGMFAWWRERAGERAAS